MGKRTVGRLAGSQSERFGSVRLGFHLVEPNGGFEHEEDVKALLADVFDDTCDMLRLGHRLVDRFA